MDVKTPRAGHIFYGWWIVLAAAVGLLFSIGPIIVFILGRYFGLRAFGEIYGYLFAGFVLGAGVAPLLMGSGFDATGSYRWVLGAFVLITLVATGLGRS